MPRNRLLLRGWLSREGRVEQTLLIGRNQKPMITLERSIKSPDREWETGSVGSRPRRILHLMQHSFYTNTPQFQDFIWELYS